MLLLLNKIDIFLGKYWNFLKEIFNPSKIITASKAFQTDMCFIPIKHQYSIMAVNTVIKLKIYIFFKLKIYFLKSYKYM